MKSLRDFLIWVYPQDRLMLGPRPHHPLRSTLLTTFSFFDLFSEYFHQHGEISRAAKVFTNESKPTNDPAHSEPLKQLFPEPREDYDSPPKMGDDSPQHWPSEQEIHDLWETDQASDRILKHHSIPALTKYIRARSLLSAPDIDGWRMKKLLQRIFLSRLFFTFCFLFPAPPINNI